MSCRQPIPLPGIVINREVLGLAGDSGTRHELREHVFSLRCRSCNREKPYRSRDIVEFEGEPRRWPSTLRSPHGVGRPSIGLSRAANG